MRLMVLSTIFAVVLGAAGCEATVTDARGPEGETAHIVRCGQSEACYQKAAEVCRDGYVLRSTAVSQGGTPTASSEILVSCNEDLR